MENEREDASGAVAIEAGEVAGYLLGRRREDQLGPHVWSYVSGHAVREPELVRDLYAVAAGAGSRTDSRDTSRTFPRSLTSSNPWLRLCFGISAALAARETAPTSAAVQADVVVRMGTLGDTAVAARTTVTSTSILSARRASPG